MSKVIEDSNVKIWIGYLVLFAAIITPSPIFLNYGPFTGNIYYLITLMFLLIYFRNKFKLKLGYFIILFMCVLVQMFGVIYWLELKLFLFSIYFLTAFILVGFVLHQDYLDLFIKLASKFIMILLIGAVIGFFYTILGGTELFHIINEDTRLNGFYLSTFSNSYVRSVIRPAGIYDEPGALSFIICIIAALRKIRGFSDKGTWRILFLGFITFSVAHVIYVFFHFLGETKTWKLKNILFLMASFLLIIFLINQSFLGIIFEEFFFRRLTIVDGELVADNRSQLFINAYNYIKDPIIFFFGLDVDCIIRGCSSKGYYDTCCNPLAPLVWGGLTLTFPYYLTCLYLIVSSIKNLSFVSFGVVLLLFQRVEVMTYGYALLIAILVFSIINKSKTNKYA